MKYFIHFLLLPAIFLCSSCVVSFENPLSDSQTSTTDLRLTGRWQEVIEKKAIFEFSSDSDKNILLSLIDEKDKSKLMFTVFTTTIGDHHYMTLKPVDEDNEKTFLLVRYEIRGDEMTTWLPNEEKINELIKQNKISGNQKSYGEVSISNSSAELKKFLESNDSDQLFESFGTLKKQ
jgi:hypothetical protein